MGRRARPKPKNAIKCPWCGRMTCWSRKHNLAPHINQAGNPCVGQGQPRHQIEAQQRLIEEQLEEADGHNDEMAPGGQYGDPLRDRVQ